MKELSSDYDTDQSRYEPGQIWKYETRPGEEDSTLTIVKVESYPELGVVVHVAIGNIQVQNPHAPNGISDTIGHMPFSEKAIDDSVTELLGVASELPDYEDGYQSWRESQGGVFSITVAEAIDLVGQAFQQKQ
jgi:hypothetical protein